MQMPVFSLFTPLYEVSPSPRIFLLCAFVSLTKWVVNHVPVHKVSYKDYATVLLLFAYDKNIPDLTPVRKKILAQLSRDFGEQLKEENQRRTLEATRLPRIPM